MSATRKPAAPPDNSQTTPEVLPPAKKSLGQNFLADASYAARIVDALGDVSQLVVIEIGPGRGALTDLLARRARRVIAIELDRVLAAQLRMKYSRVPQVEIIEADVLAVDFNTILGPGPGTTFTGFAPAVTQAKVVGNIPYYITSDILLRLLQFPHHFSEIVLMVQAEVADRIAAKPGTRDYGLLSATAQLYGHVDKLFTVPPGAFTPAPKVHSAVLRMKIAPRFAELQIDSPAAFIDFLKTSFAQKRKTLCNNLKETYGDAAVRAALAKAKLRADVRAEAVPLEKAAVVYRELVHA